MDPMSIFHDAWVRCSDLAALRAYLERNVAGVLKPDELLRAEWVARVSALDLYVHEFIAQRMLAIFERKCPESPGYRDFKISTATLHRIQGAQNPAAAANAFDLEVRKQLAFQTYQHPEKIAAGMRLCSEVELWNKVGNFLGEDPRDLRTTLAEIVERRNKIAHEGDMQPSMPRIPWPINAGDLQLVEKTIERIVRGMDAVVNTQ